MEFLRLCFSLLRGPPDQRRKNYININFLVWFSCGHSWILTPTPGLQKNQLFWCGRPRFLGTHVHHPKGSRKTSYRKGLRWFLGPYLKTFRTAFPSFAMIWGFAWEGKSLLCCAGFLACCPKVNAHSSTPIPMFLASREELRPWSEKNSEKTRPPQTLYLPGKGETQTMARASGEGKLRPWSEFGVCLGRGRRGGSQKGEERFNACTPPPWQRESDFPYPKNLLRLFFKK